MFNFFPPLRAGALAASLTLLAGLAAADVAAIVQHENVAWQPMGSTGAQMALLSGDPAQANPYAIMVKVPEGTLWQPDAQSGAQRLTIVSGTLVWSTGKSFEDGSMTALVPGGVWTVPSATDQRGWAWNGDVLAIVTGIGPDDMASVGDE